MNTIVSRINNTWDVRGQFGSTQLRSWDWFKLPEFEPRQVILVTFKYSTIW